MTSKLTFRTESFDDDETSRVIIGSCPCKLGFSRQPQSEGGKAETGLNNMVQIASEYNNVIIKCLTCSKKFRTTSKILG